MQKFAAMIAAMLISLAQCDRSNDDTNQISKIDGTWIADKDTMTISNQTIFFTATKKSIGFSLLNDCYLREYLNDSTSVLCIYEFKNDSLGIIYCPTDSKPYYSTDHDKMTGIWQTSGSMTMEFRSDNTVIVKDENLAVNGTYTQDNCKLIMHSSDSIPIYPETSYVYIENDSLHMNTTGTNVLWYLKN